MYSVEMNDNAKDLSLGHSVTFQCIQRFNLEDENCQENSKSACNNDEDDDGNGVWDCQAGPNHFADPNCCPLILHENNTCSPASNYNTICPNTPVTNNDPDLETVCQAHARISKCTLKE
jgi:hypothetical protein